MNSVFTRRDGDILRQTLRAAFLSALLALALSVPFLSAQTATFGSIAGTIQDSTGAILADAKVTVTSPALVVAQSTLTSGQGTYRFPVLPPGTYAIAVEAPGFQIGKRENIIITAGFSATVDMPMA